MRPGHRAPENGGREKADGKRSRASMRPGHRAPENDHVGPGEMRRLVLASMRPGHRAPENEQIKADLTRAAMELQ